MYQTGVGALTMGDCLGWFLWVVIGTLRARCPAASVDGSRNAACHVDFGTRFRNNRVFTADPSLFLRDACHQNEAFSHGTHIGYNLGLEHPILHYHSISSNIIPLQYSPHPAPPSSHYLPSLGSKTQPQSTAAHSPKVAVWMI